VRAAVALRIADRLALADRHVAAICSRRLEHAEGGQVDVGDGKRPGSRAAAASAGASSRQPKKFGCGKITAAAPSAAAAIRAGSVTPPSCATSTTSSPNPGA